MWIKKGGFWYCGIGMARARMGGTWVGVGIQELWEVVIWEND